MSSPERQVWLAHARLGRGRLLRGGPSPNVVQVGHIVPGGHAAGIHPESAEIGSFSTVGISGSPEGDAKVDPRESGTAIDPYGRVQPSQSRIVIAGEQLLRTSIGAEDRGSDLIRDESELARAPLCRRYSGLEDVGITRRTHVFMCGASSSAPEQVSSHGRRVVWRPPRRSASASPVGSARRPIRKTSTHRPPRPLRSCDIRPFPHSVNRDRRHLPQLPCPTGTVPTNPGSNCRTRRRDPQDSKPRARAFDPSRHETTPLGGAGQRSRRGAPRPR